MNVPWRDVNEHLTPDREPIIDQSKDSKPVQLGEPVSLLGLHINHRW